MNHVLSRMSERAWAAVVFILALAPRLIGLDARPFWLDEVFTLQRVSLSPSALVQDSFYNHHMPAFFLLLAPLVALGHPEYWLRLPSALFGALDVSLVFVIGTQVASQRAGGLAALVLGLSPAALAYSQEARSYTLVMALILVSLWGLIGLVQNVQAAALPLRGSPVWRAWAAFILGAALALDVLGDSLPWLLTANLIFLVVFALTKRPRGFLLNLLKADAIVLAAAAPFYVAMHVYQEKGFVATLAWIPPLDLPHFWYSVGSVYFMNIADAVTFRLMDVSTPAAVVWVIDAALIAAVGLAAWRLRHRPALLAALGLSFIILPVLLTVISLWHPVLLPRYILWSAAPFAILAGIGGSALLEGLPGHLRAPVVALAVVMLMANLLPYYKAETKPRWDIAAQMLASEVAPGDVLYLHDQYDGTLLNVYLPAQKRAVVMADAQGDITHVQAAISQGKRVWTVYGVAGQGLDNPQEHAAFDTRAAVLGTPSLRQQAGSRITITLYNPGAQGRNGQE